MNMECWWDDSDRLNPKQSEKNPPKCHFIHYIFHVDWTDWDSNRTSLANRRSHGRVLTCLSNCSYFNS